MFLISSLTPLLAPQFRRYANLHFAWLSHFEIYYIIFCYNFGQQTRGQAHLLSIRN